ncbi:hypothetical protein L6259_00625 [Candidatus Parcubacteria bacterium]|nr:hypothetical protein [Patescibacteria group bacterium]MCG2693777.1 hypothetical protein [Candidatus Parcubacteria bacterium]
MSADQVIYDGLRKREQEIRREMAEIKCQVLEGHNLAYELSLLRNERQTIRTELGKLAKRLHLR